MNDYYAVIMAGGGGTRLWPLSRKTFPKQLLSIFGDTTLFQSAINRLNGVFDPENILIVSTEELKEKLLSSSPIPPTEQYLDEPEPRGTAAVIALAAAVLAKSNPTAVMAVLTADHTIQNVAVFQKLLKQAYQAAQDGNLVTLGIEPERPATGFGYIEKGSSLSLSGVEEVYTVQRFTEKPSLDQAVKMVSSGKFLWNSGMFFWRVDVILNEFKTWMPELHEKIMTIQRVWGTAGQSTVLHSVWPTIKPETIDYGIMEKAQKVVTIPAQNLGWNDVGSWESLFEVYSPDQNGMVSLAKKSLGIGSTSSLIYESLDDKIVTTLGIDNLIIIDTPDALMICTRDKAQQIKEIITNLKEGHLENYL